MDNLLLKIVEIGIKYRIQKIILFGSRARGDFSKRSDYDIAFISSNLTHEIENNIINLLSEIDTLYKIDYVFLKNLKSNDELTNNIIKDGVIVMDKFTAKLENFGNALSRLKEALEKYANNDTDSMYLDAIIQRFEFTTELAWKTTKEYLISENFLENHSPKSVMKTAFSIDLIEDEQGWLQLLNDRNATFHIYSEDEANIIFERIRLTHVNLFIDLYNKLNLLNN